MQPVINGQNTTKWIKAQIPEVEIDSDTCVQLTRAGDRMDWDLAVWPLFVCAQMFNGENYIALGIGSPKSVLPKK